MKITSLLINNEFFLKNENEIIYVCDKCNNEEKHKYYRDKRFHQKQILCVKCNKIKNMIEKYGVENISQLPEHKNKISQAYLKKSKEEKLETNEKRRKTNLERYGFENFFQNKEILKKANEKRSDPKIQEKISQTKLEKYGDENYNNSDKNKETCLKRYGVSNANKTKKIKEKISRTKKNYTRETKDKIQEKRNKTNLKKYGEKFPYRWGSSFFRQLMLKKYGVTQASQNIHSHHKSMSGFGRSQKLKYFSANLHYQNNYEYQFINYCINNNIDVKDGPTIKYILNKKIHYYHIDFETPKYIIEIKGSHPWYFEDLKNGKIEAKNNAAKIFATENNKEFLFLLDVKNYSNYLE